MSLICFLVVNLDCYLEFVIFIIDVLVFYYLCVFFNGCLYCFLNNENDYLVFFLMGIFLLKYLFLYMVDE